MQDENSSSVLAGTGPTEKFLCGTSVHLLWGVRAAGPQLGFKGEPAVPQLLLTDGLWLFCTTTNYSGKTFLFSYSSHMEKKKKDLRRMSPGEVLDLQCC